MFDALALPPTRLKQLYLVWNQLSTQEQKELCAQKAADLLLVAPTEVGMWVYGGKVLNVAGKSAADVARAGAKVANPLWTGVMAGVGRVRNSPIAHSIRNSLARFGRSHLQDGYVQFGKRTVPIEILKKEIESAMAIYQTAKKIRFEDLVSYNSKLEKFGFGPLSKKAYKHILMSHYPDGAKYINNKLATGKIKSVFNINEHFLELAIEALEKGSYLSKAELVYDFKRVIGMDKTGHKATKLLINITMENEQRVIRSIYPC